LKKRNVLILILLLTTIGAAYFIGRNSVKELEPEVIEIDLTESEILQVQQEATLNMITLDSAMTWLEGLETVDRINWVNKTKWNFKDSTVEVINIRDSINVVYIPFYEARDTIVHFDEIVEETRVELSLAVKPRFFPTIERFVTDVQMRRLVLTRPIEVESFWKHRISLVLGYGIGYYQQTETTHTNTIFIDDDDYNGFNNINQSVTTTMTKRVLNHGLQLTLGIRIW